MAKYSNSQNNKAVQDFNIGYNIVCSNPVFCMLLGKVEITKPHDYNLPKNAYAIAVSSGKIYINKAIRQEPEVWARIVAHCLLHFAMGHFVEKEREDYWNIACDLVIEKFLSDFKFGKPYYSGALPGGITSEEKLYERFMQDGVPEEYYGYGTCNEQRADMIFSKENTFSQKSNKDYAAAFASGITCAVKNAVDIAGGITDILSSSYDNEEKMTKAKKARNWFISSYPLLGAIASNFTIVEDQILCHRMNIAVAAISCDMKEIYINPLAKLTYEECKFILAHEFLHAALSHGTRAGWRDSYLWNVACDFVINVWLTQMKVGVRPAGVLYDEKYKDFSAEAVYDDIMLNIKAVKYFVTLRGNGLGDIMPSDENWYKKENGAELDEFFRRAIEQGLGFFEGEQRGFLPAGLIEEIRALNHVPIPWDIELARWFDEMFVPLEKKRSYARVSRRQSSTPDIPRASYVQNEQQKYGRTFGVILDTSGSMDRRLLALCLGAIASYSVSKEVTAVRVVFCDAEAYDMGYMLPEEIAGSVKIMGRGGTILQPGIDLLCTAKDFPKDAPILIITDGYCEDNLLLHGREHGYLIPFGANLPFLPKGEVFRVRQK